MVRGTVPWYLGTLLCFTMRRGLAAAFGTGQRAPIHAASQLSPDVLKAAFEFMRTKLLGEPTALGGPRTHEDLKRAVGHVPNFQNVAQAAQLGTAIGGRYPM